MPYLPFLQCPYAISLHSSTMPECCLLRRSVWVWCVYIVPILTLTSHCSSPHAQPCAPHHNFLFGHLLYLKKRMDALPKNAHYQYMFADIAREHFQSEGLFYVDSWPASGMMMIVTSAVVAAQVTQTNTKICYERPSMLRRFFNPIAGGPNLFDMAEREWRPWRAIFAKGFSTEQVTSLVPHVLKETKVYKETLRELARKEEMFYLDLVTLRFMSDVMGRTVL